MADREQDLSKMEEIRQEREPEPTTPEEWNQGKNSRSKGFVVDLPSGNRAKVRRTFDLPTLIKMGRIPNPLGNIIKEALAEGQQGMPEAEKLQQAGAIEQLLDFLDQNTIRMMVEPQISGPDPKNHDEEEETYIRRIEAWEPDPGTLSIFDVGLEDKLYLFFVGQGGATELESFREAASQFVGDVPAGEGVERQAESTVGADG